MVTTTGETLQQCDKQFALNYNEVKTHRCKPTQNQLAKSAVCDCGHWPITEHEQYCRNLSTNKIWKYAWGRKRQHTVDWRLRWL